MEDLKKRGFSFLHSQKKKCSLYVTVCLPTHQASEAGRLTLD